MTALVKINIKTNKVVKVELVKGASELNIDTLGLSNDFTYLNGRYYGAWYQENGKENYSNRVGTINEELKGKGKIGELKKEKRAAVFGISVFDKKQEIFAMGIRQKININGKDGLKRYIATYKSKKEKDGTKYVKQSRIITLRKNNDYNVPQCMEIYNKKIYLIKYFSKGKKKGKKIKKIEKRVKYKNNVVEIYDFNGIKVTDFSFDEENDIVWEDYTSIIFHKIDSDNEYVEYNLKAKEIHHLKCQEIRVIDDSDELIVMIRKNGQWGVFKYVGVDFENAEFYGFKEIIPIQYDKISGNGYYSYAKYTSKDLYGYQETFEDVYDQDGNLIMTIEL